MSKENITYERVHEVLDYNKLTGIFIWLISANKNITVGDIAGHGDDGYIRIKIDGKQYLAHRLAWLYTYGYFPEHGLDHKDRIRHHNWIENLREASKSCNAKNTGNRIDNTSGVKGVTWKKKSQKWCAQIKVNGSCKFLGEHKDFEEAVCHRLSGEQCLNWSNCDSSSPAYQYVQKNIIKVNIS